MGEVYLARAENLGTPFQYKWKARHYRGELDNIGEMVHENDSQSSARVGLTETVLAKVVDEINRDPSDTKRVVAVEVSIQYEE